MINLKKLRWAGHIACSVEMHAGLENLIGDNILRDLGVGGRKY
jgi:hypothetical protein